VAQDAVDAAELVEDRRAGLLDVLQCRAGRFRPGVEKVARDPGLHADDGDMVRDDVVQLPSDPQPLLGDAAARLLVPAALGPQRPFLDCRDEQARLRTASPTAANTPVIVKVEKTMRAAPASARRGRHGGNDDGDGRGRPPQHRDAPVDVRRDGVERDPERAAGPRGRRAAGTHRAGCRPRTRRS